MINCAYRNFRLDNLKTHLKSGRHKINNIVILNKIFEIVRSNSLPEGNLLRVEDNEVIQVAMPMDSQLRNTTLIQDQVASTSGSTRSQSSAAPQETLHSQEPIATVTADTDEQFMQFTDLLTVTEPLQPQATASSSSQEIHSLQEAVASLHTAIQTIKINERGMKTVLVDAKAVLESKLSEIDQRLDKADNVATIVDNSTQSLVHLQMTYPWLQVKLRSPPNAPYVVYVSAILYKYVRFVVTPACRIGSIVLLCLIAIIVRKELKIMNSQKVIKAASQQKNKEKGMLSYFPLKLLKRKRQKLQKGSFCDVMD